jgi:transcriptional regulator with XRE-family HTH domain
MSPEILLKQRIKKGMSQEEVAKAIGVSQKSYSHYENGTRNPKIDKIIKLAKLLGIELTFSTSTLNGQKNQNEINIIPESLEEQLKSIKIENKFLKDENAELKKIIETKDEKIAELNKKIGGLEMMVEFKNNALDTLNNAVLPLKKVAQK